MKRLYFNTVKPALRNALEKIMGNPAFKQFYLAGGTALSLQRGHRQSIDIDLFTDAEYGTINTSEISNTLSEMFCYTERLEELKQRQMVYSLYVGDNSEEIIKLDLCYDEHLICNAIETNGIRIADERDIAAMKIEAIAQTNQRRKDFWDIHDLLESYTLCDLIEFHEKRYPWSHNKEEIAKSIKRCALTTDQTEVLCLKNKYWEFIVEDLLDAANNL